MKTVTALLALSMLAGPLAMAQDRDHGRPEQHDDRGDHAGPPDRHDAPPRRAPPPRALAATHRDDHDERGAGPDHAFRRGGRLPMEFRNRQYVVDDWRAHHLNAPPRGYHWVQTGADYVLVAVATGVIAQILLAQ